MPGILDGITKAMEVSNEDPFSSTFEALRVMQSTISKFTPQSLAVRIENESFNVWVSEYQFLLIQVHEVNLFFFLSLFQTQTLSSSSSEFVHSANSSPVTERRPRSHALLSVSPAHSRQTSAPIEWSGSANSLPSPSHIRKSSITLHTPVYSSILIQFYVVCVTSICTCTLLLFIYYFVCGRHC